MEDFFIVKALILIENVLKLAPDEFPLSTAGFMIYNLGKDD